MGTEALADSCVYTYDLSNVTLMISVLSPLMVNLKGKQIDYKERALEGIKIVKECR